MLAAVFFIYSLFNLLLLTVCVCIMIWSELRKLKRNENPPSVNQTLMLLFMKHHRRLLTVLQHYILKNKQTNCARMYYESLQTEALFHAWLNVGFIALRDTGHICICILIDPVFNFFTDIWFKATDISASSASLTHTWSQHQPNTHSQTHKQTLTASSDASGCYRNTNTSITSAYTAPQRHRLRPHVTSGTELTRRQMRARAQKPRFSAVWVKLVLRRIQFISNTNNSD